MSATNLATGNRSVPRASSPLPTRRRRPGLTALGVVLILGLAAVGAYLYNSAGAKTPVVVVTDTVPAGHIISRADLSTVAVAGDVVAIAAARLPNVVGQHAAVTLLAGTLMQRSMLSTGSGLPSGDAQVGVKVTSGQIPADGLAPGDIVQVLQLPDSDASSSAGATVGSGSNGGVGSTAQVLVTHAQVFTARDDPAQSGGTLLTLVVPGSDAAAVATASGAGLVALIRIDEGS
jgi:hypothetical protein